MTEDQWNNCSDPQAMLALLLMAGQACARKLRLLLCGLYRQNWMKNFPARTRRVVEVAERYADGLASQKELLDAGSTARDALAMVNQRRRRGGTGTDNPLYESDLYLLLLVENSEDKIVNELRLMGFRESFQRVAPQVYREIFGPIPLRAVPVAESWLRWNDGCVRRTAQAIYDEGRFEDLPILADALEDAGCDNPDILRHCREQGRVHVRGCWATDVLLQKA